MRYKQLGGRSITVHYDSNNRVTSSVDIGNLGGNTGTRSFQHDSRGNVTAAGGLMFSYDYANQPVALSGTSSGSYGYDGHNRRVKAVVNGKTIYNVFNQAGQLVHIDNLSTQEKTDYIQLQKLSIARVTNNNPTYLHSDILGSPVAGTNAAGDVVFREKYTPFGITLDNPAANANQAGYTGHIKDSDTGLVYMQQRYYDPIIGRFYSNDPVGFTASNPMMFNRYAYANNNPYKYVDPDGREPFNFQWISQVQNPSTTLFSQSQAAQFNQTASHVSNGMAAVAPHNPAGVLLGTVGLAAGVVAASTGVGAAPGALVTLASLDGIRSSWTGGRTLSGMGLEAVGDAFDLEDGSISRLGNFGDFMQNTASGGAQSLHSAAKNVGNIGDAAGATSQVRDMANMAGGVQTYSVNGRIDSAKLAESLEKKD